MFRSAALAAMASGPKDIPSDPKHIRNEPKYIFNDPPLGGEDMHGAFCLALHGAGAGAVAGAASGDGGAPVTVRLDRALLHGAVAGAIAATAAGSGSAGAASSVMFAAVFRPSAAKRS